MTKNFCDHCGVEIVNDEYIKISFMGVIKKYMYKSVCFCEKCFIEVDKELSKYIKKEEKLA